MPQRFQEMRNITQGWSVILAVRLKT